VHLISAIQQFAWKFPICLIFPDLTNRGADYIQKFHDSVVEVCPNLFELPAEVQIQQRNAQQNYRLFHWKKADMPGTFQLFCCVSDNRGSDF